MVILQKRMAKYILKYIKKPSIFGLLVVLGMITYQIYGCDLHNRPYVSDDIRVVDGDTIVLDNKLRIRLHAMCAGHDVRAKGSSPLWAEIERSIS